MKAHEKLSQIRRLKNQANILQYDAHEIEEKRLELKRQLLNLSSQKIELQLKASSLLKKADTLEREFFEENNLIKRKRPITLYDCVVAQFGKEAADLIKDEIT